MQKVYTACEQDNYFNTIKYVFPLFVEFKIYKMCNPLLLEYNLITHWKIWILLNKMLQKKNAHCVQLDYRQILHNVLQHWAAIPYLPSTSHFIGSLATKSPVMSRGIIDSFCRNNPQKITSVLNIGKQQCCYNMSSKIWNYSVSCTNSLEFHRVISCDRMLFRAKSC